MAAADSAAKILVGSIVVVFIAGILVGNFADVIDAQRPGKAADFNTTMDNVFTFAWLVLGFMAIGILIFGARYILLQVGYL